MDTAALEPGQTDSGNQQAERFVTNVIWTLLAVGTSFFTGFFLSRYIIRTLGEARYGIWSLTFAFVESFGLFDLGFRTAVVNFTSRLRARGETDGINQVINTSLVYFLAIGGFIALLTILLGGRVHRFFNISELYRADFSVLVRLIGISWALGMIFGVFQAGLEAFQHFKLYYRIAVSMLLIRSIGCALAVLSGHSLVAMGVIVLVTQCTLYLLTMLLFARVFPSLRFSPALFSYPLWKDMARYGARSFVANSSLMMLMQGPPLLVGHFLSDVFVGFYTLPARLFQYAVEMVTRIGFITAPNTAELIALGRTDQVIKLGMYLNRYCFALFLPLSVFLGIFGRDLIRAWVGERFALNTAPLLLPFMLSTSFALAGQFNSSSILFGMAKHGAFAKGLFIECVLLLSGLWFVIPRFGIVGAAWLAASLMIADRGIFTPYILCRHLDFSFIAYMHAIYSRALICAIPATAAALAMKRFLIPATNWAQLFLALGVVTSLYYVVAIWFCVEPDHRALARDLVLRRLRRFQPIA
jgi:O-antigen/teichoic acid export membrane protein